MFDGCIMRPQHLVLAFRPQQPHAIQRKAIQRKVIARPLRCASVVRDYLGEKLLHEALKHARFINNHHLYAPLQKCDDVDQIHNLAQAAADCAAALCSQEVASWRVG